MEGHPAFTIFKILRTYVGSCTQDKDAFRRYIAAEKRRSPSPSILKLHRYNMEAKPVPAVYSRITSKLADKECFDKEQIGVKEPFPVTNCHNS